MGMRHENTKLLLAGKLAREPVQEPVLVTPSPLLSTGLAACPFPSCYGARCENKSTFSCQHQGEAVGC